MLIWWPWVRAPAGAFLPIMCSDFLILELLSISQGGVVVARVAAHPSGAFSKERTPLAVDPWPWFFLFSLFFPLRSVYFQYWIVNSNLNPLRRRGNSYTSTSSR